jgi:ubiquinone/menaquinone biosynthesis C-methylase UbiE
MSEHHDRPHGHRHHHDRGWRAVVRYARCSRKMWRSPVNREVITQLDVRADERVLDVGAGMGAGVVLAAQKGARVVAVDPTPFMRLVLRVRRLGQRARKRIEILDGAAEHLPVADASVDAAWSVNAMHHWGDLDAGIAELRRVMRRGGRVLLVDEDFDDPAHESHERFGARRRHREHEFAHVDPAVVGAKLDAAGFGVTTADKTVFGGQPAKLVRATKA